MDMPDFFKRFDENDCKEIRRIARLYPTSVLKAASMYSGKNTLGVDMARVILGASIRRIDVSQVVFLLGDMLDVCSKYREDGPNEMMLQMLQDNILCVQDDGISNSTSAIRRWSIQPIEVCQEPGDEQLVQYIKTCSESEFDLLLYYIARITRIRFLPENIILVTLERSRQRLKNDQAFFMSLYAAFMTSVSMFLSARLAEETGKTIGLTGASRVIRPEDMLRGTTSSMSGPHQK